MTSPGDDRERHADPPAPASSGSGEPQTVDDNLHQRSWDALERDALGGRRGGAAGPKRQRDDSAAGDVDSEGGPDRSRPPTEDPIKRKGG